MKQYCPSCLHAAGALLPPFSCKRKVVCVCFLLGRCAPHHPTTTFSWPYISWAEESRSFEEEEEMKERTRRRREKSITTLLLLWLSGVTAEEEAKGPEFPELDAGGEEEEEGAKSIAFSAPVVLRSKWETLVSSKPELWCALKKKKNTRGRCASGGETACEAGERFSSIHSFIQKLSAPSPTMHSWPRGKGRGLW